jgi:hypothetical protein
MATIQEILVNANKNIETIKAHVGNNYLRALMEAAYVKEKKLLLPEGDPPFKKPDIHPDQVGGTMWQIAKKIDIFRRADAVTIKRENAFIQALESVSEMDAKILLAVKDQTLDKLFPALTVEELKRVGYFR